MPTVTLEAGSITAVLDPARSGALLDLTMGDTPLLARGPHADGADGPLSVAVAPAVGAMTVIDRSPISCRLAGCSGAAQALLRYEVSPTSCSAAWTVSAEASHGPDAPVPVAVTAIVPRYRAGVDAAVHSGRDGGVRLTWSLSGVEQRGLLLSAVDGVIGVETTAEGIVVRVIAERDDAVALATAGLMIEVTKGV